MTGASADRAWASNAGRGGRRKGRATMPTTMTAWLIARHWRYVCFVANLYHETCEGCAGLGVRDACGRWNWGLR
eukprot:7309385-Pyramimonas_sp.AAC.1